MDFMDDSALMARVRKGRTESLAHLFDRHHGPLYGFFLRMTGQKALSEDLVQESFLRVLRFASTFREGAPFRPWLYRIGRNVLADHWGRQRPEVDLEPLAGILPAEGPCAHARLEEAQDQDRLAQALARLPAEKRELLLLSRDPDMSGRDLAECFGCTPGAVKVRVHRALQDLRSAFFGGPPTPADQDQTCMEVPS